MATAADLMMSFAEDNKKIADAVVDTAFKLKEGEADRQVIETATQTIKQSEEVVQKQQAVGELVAKTATREIATNLGLNPEVKNSAADIMLQLQNTLVDAADDANKALSDIEAAGPPSFGQKLINSLLARKGISTETDAEYRLRIADSRLTEATKALTSVNNVLQESATSQTAIAPTINATTVEARATALKASTDAAVAQARLDTAKYNTEGLRELRNLDQQALRNKVDAFQIEAAAEQRQAVAAQRELLNQERIDRATAKKATADEQAQIIADVRVGLAELNGRVTPNIPDKTILEGLSDKRRNPDILAAANLGFARRLGEKSQVASSPGKVAAIIYATDAKFTQEASGVRDVVLDSLRLASEGRSANVAVAADPNFNSKDPASVERLASDNAMFVAKRDGAEIDVRNNSNIYQAPTPASVIAAVPAVKNNAFIAKVILPQVETGLKTTDPDLMLSFGEAAIADGSFSFAEVSAGLSEFFNAAVAVNNTVKMYDKFALPEQRSYNALVQNPYGVGRKVVDLTDQAKVNLELTRRLAQRRTREILQTFTSGKR